MVKIPINANPLEVYSALSEYARSKTGTNPKDLLNLWLVLSEEINKEYKKILKVAQ